MTARLRPALAANEVSSFLRAKAAVKAVRPAQWMKNGFVLMVYPYVFFAYADVSLSLFISIVLFGMSVSVIGIMDYSKDKKCNVALKSMKFKRLKAVVALLALPFLRFVGGAQTGDLIKAVLLFCFAACTVYLFNDLLDVEKDRLHPDKMFRPIASGELPVPFAWGMFLGLSLLTICGSAGMGIRLCAIYISYLVLSHVYTLLVKHLPFGDIMLVGSLYGIRVLAGYESVSLYPPFWWGWVGLACTLSCAIEIGKRQSEVQKLGTTSKTRPTLKFYGKYACSLYWIFTALTVGFYPLVAVQIKPVFGFSDILVGLGMVFYWRRIKALKEDLHPMKVIMHSPEIISVLVLFVIFFLLCVKP